MDLAVTFHIGLCLRMPRAERQKPGRNIVLFGAIFTRLREASDALGQAQNVADYQAIGMRSREALLAFVGAAQDVGDWGAKETLPKRGDFRAWSELICNAALAGASQKERRHLFKSLL